ncbi:hypothetical protein CISIN_1g036477mg [Citrus sinensis]|uniref:Uncharacterized protein n=1 Tax=Citrus sinensis TaxID=2711 RepID=A0A067FTS2_CITSI|nr:hypothetical protein CISIN_1g036477mg [Citrus sinensis]
MRNTSLRIVRQPCWCSTAAAAGIKYLAFHDCSVAQLDPTLLNAAWAYEFDLNDCVYTFFFIKFSSRITFRLIIRVNEGENG